MSAGSRRTASITLAVAGSVLALVGGFALYARAEVFDRDAFATHTAESLKDEQVREALAEPIVDQAIDRGPDVLINARPVVLAAVEGVLDSAPFRAMFRKAARKAYAAIFSKDKEEIALSLNDADVLVSGAVGNFAPKFKDKVPQNLGDRLVTVTESDILLTVARVSEDVRFLGIVLPVLALLCLGGSIAIAVDRRGALIQASAGIAAAAVAGFIALLIVRGLVLSQFGDDTVHDAAEAVWEAFFDGLLSWTLGVGVLAIVVTAAAAMVREADPLAPARRLVAFAGRTPGTTAGRAGRAVGAGAAGLLFLLQPTFALQIVAVLVGGYALFFAACELLSLIPAQKGRARERRLPSTRIAVAGAAILAALVVWVVAVTGGDGERREIARPPGPVVNCNGFAELCEKPIDEVAFPGAHNAMSAAELPAWYQPNQRYDIRRQLDDGIRAFLIDSHYGINRPSGPVLTDLEREGSSKVLEGIEAELGPEAVSAFQAITARYANRGGEGKQGAYLCHVVCELGSIDLGKALGWFKDFLITHPDEVLILFIEDKVHPGDTAAEFERSGILPYAFIQKEGRPFPTMRELIESDRRLFVMAEEDAGAGAYPWYHQGFALGMETPYTFHTPKELAAKASCDPNRGGTGKPLFQLNHWVEKLPRSPSTAETVNSLDFLGRRARICERRRGALPNIVAVDYYDKGDVVGATQALNGLPLDAEPSYRETG